MCVYRFHRAQWLTCQLLPASSAFPARRRLPCNNRAATFVCCCFDIGYEIHWSAAKAAYCTYGHTSAKSVQENKSTQEPYQRCTVTATGRPRDAAPPRQTELLHRHRLKGRIRIRIIEWRTQIVYNSRVLRRTVLCIISGTRTRRVNDRKIKLIRCNNNNNYCRPRSVSEIYDFFFSYIII